MYHSIGPLDPERLSVFRTVKEITGGPFGLCLLYVCVMVRQTFRVRVFVYVYALALTALKGLVYKPLFFILNHDLQLNQTANGVKLHFHYGSTSNKIEQWPLHSPPFPASSLLMSFP